MRVKIFSIICAVMIAVLIGALAYIQIIRHDRYRIMSEENRLKVITLRAPRGSISDRRGQVLVKDVISFDVSVIYSRVRDKEALSAELSSILGEDRETVEERLRKASRRRYSPVKIAGDIGIDKAVHIEEIEMNFPGLTLDVGTKRTYMDKDVAGNLLGYLGYINRYEFDRLKHYGYDINDMVGRDGIERQYDEYLRGKHGGKQVEVDYRGRRATTLGLKEPVPGKDIKLTIDIDLQKFCHNLMADKKGAIVVMDPRTGAVLAMESSPSYDPGAFIDRARSDEVKDVLADGDYPLLNRCIAGAYPPGSIFKAVVASAALQEGVISERTEFVCEGSLTLGKRVFHCWKKEGHGTQSIVEAIKNSCNVFFWRTGMLVGVDKIAAYAARFGLGRRTGIDLPGEVPGVLPSSEWKERTLKEKWYKGETLNYSVGQGYLLVTPLQMACMMSAFANGGYIVRPYVVEDVSGVPVNAVSRTETGVSADVLDTVRQGLREVVNDPRGTGMKARLQNVVVAGKTGTAQTSRGRSHGWFAGFAPFDDPKVVVVVFDEYGGKGGYYAAKTAGKVLKEAEDLGLL